MEYSISDAETDPHSESQHTRDNSDSENDRSVASDYNDEGGPLQLIKIQRTSDADEHLQLVLNKHTLDTVIESCGDRPVCAISIVGGVRVGKSLLLNLIKDKLKSAQSGRRTGSRLNSKIVKGFQFKSGYKPVTKGIWVWSKAFIVDGDDGEVAVLLLDTEGINDEISTSEEITAILGLSLLSSSILLLNFSSDLSLLPFDWLSPFLTNGKNKKQDQPPFQKLSVLIRDWTKIAQNKWGDKGGRRLLDKFLEKNDSHPCVRVTNTFEAIDCCLLPHAGEKAVQPSFQGHTTDLDRDFQRHVQKYLKSLLDSQNLTPKKIFNNDLAAPEFKDFFVEFVNYFNTLATSETGVKADAISTLIRDTAGNIKIANGLQEYKRIFQQRKKSTKAGIFRDSAIDGMHVQAKRKALQAFRKFSLPKEEEKQWEAKFEQELNKGNNSLKTENQATRNNKVGDGLKKAYTQLKQELERKYPFKAGGNNGRNSIPDNLVFYLEADLLKTIKSTKKGIEQEFLEIFAAEDDDEVASLKNSLNSKLAPLSEQYLNNNKENKNRAVGRAEEVIHKLVEHYKTTMQKKIKKLPKMDAGTLSLFHDGEMEKVEEKFKGITLGTEEFEAEWSEKLMAQIEHEFELLQGNLESTLAESMQLATKLVENYSAELTETAKDLQESEVEIFHKKVVQDIMKNFKDTCPIGAKHPKFEALEEKLSAQLEEVYKSVVVNGIVAVQKTQEKLKEALNNSVTKIQNDLDKTLAENEFFDDDECEDLLNTTQENSLRELEADLAGLGITDGETVEQEKQKFTTETEKIANIWKRNNAARKLAATTKFDELVEDGADKYDKEMTKSVKKLKTYEDLQAEHQRIKDVVCSRFRKHGPANKKALVEEYLARLEERMDEICEEIQGIIKIKIEGEDNITRVAVSEARKMYQENIERNFNNNQHGFFNDKDLKKMHNDTRLAVIKSVTKDHQLEQKQLDKIDMQLSKLYAKFQDKNDMVRRSYSDKEPAIGIDLGTTYCCVGVYHMGKVVIVRNDSGNTHTTPSYVTINKDGTTMVGSPSKDQAYRNPEATIFDAKRIIGRRMDDEKLQEDMKFWPFLVEEKDGRPQIKVTNKHFYPEQISAMLLKHLKQEAEKFLNMKITKAVITVPAYFTDGQRQATVDAGEVAGLKVLGILNEPTAGAVAYRLEWYTHGRPKKVLVYDLGGGTFDVAVLEISDDKMNVLSVSGDSHLGGQDFDQNLMEYCAEMFKKETGIDLLEGKDSETKVTRDDARRRLKRLQYYCETAKKSLTATDSTTISIDAIVQGKDFNLEISRETFEKRNEPLFQKTIEMVETALKSAKLSKEDIDDVILVGGSTRIVKLQEMLEEHFRGKALNKRINPDEAVAYGAAVQAAILNAKPGSKLFDFGQIQEVTPMSLGIEVKGGHMSQILPKNTKIPTQVTEEYTTCEDGQKSVSIKICQGEETVAEKNKLLGTFVLNGIPRGPAGSEMIEVTMKIDLNGILHVEAMCKSTKGKNSMTVSEEKGRLSKDDKKRLLGEVCDDDTKSKFKRLLEA